MTNLSLHSKGLWLASLLFMLTITVAGVYLYKPELSFIAFIMVALTWLLSRIKYLFYLLVASIPWSVEFQQNGLSTDLPDEPLMLLMSVAVILFMIANRKRLDAGPFRSFLFWIILLQLLWSGFSAITSTDQLVSAKFFLAKCWYLFAFLITPMILFTDRTAIVNTTKVLAVSMLLLVAVTMFRHYGEAFSFSGINPSLKPFFRNHVNYSALLACMVPLLLAFFTGEKRKATKNWIAVLTIICLLAVYLSYARGAWLAVILGIGAWWLVTKRKLFVAYILSMVFVFASLVWLVNNNNYLRFSHDYKTTIFHENFSEHLVATYQFKDVSTAERFYRWIAGVRMVKDNWQTGFGPNTFPDQYKYYTVPAFKTWVSANEDRSTVHNYFLTVTIEQGIPGLILLLLMVGYAFYTTEKIYHRSSDPLLRTGARTAAMLLTILCVVNFLSDLVETDKIGSVFYMTLAAIIVLQYKAYKEQRL